MTHPNMAKEAKPKPSVRDRKNRHETCAEPSTSAPAPPSREAGGAGKTQFEVGDKAVYPSQGVAEVVGIDKKEIMGKIQHFYVLRILDSDMRILVPVDKADQVGLRDVVQEEQIREVFNILKDREVHIDKQTWNRRYRGFMEKIKTGSLFEVAEVYRDLFRLKTTKTLSFGERRMLDTAKNLIVKELSVARKTTEVKMEKELERAVSC